MINHGEKEIGLRRSQQQRNYLMNHHESTSTQHNNQNQRRRGAGQHQGLSRDQRRNQSGGGGGSDYNKRSRLASKKNGILRSKEVRKAYKNRDTNRPQKTSSSFKLPECIQSTGCVNITKTFATLGRTASMNCLAQNLVGQKTVREIVTL